MDRPPPDQLYEPLPRSQHVTVEVEGRVYSWSGWTGSGYCSPSLIEVFNPETGLWHQQPTTGEIPPAVSQCAYATIGSKLYVFGGWDGSSRHNSLHELDLSTMVWREVRPRNPSDGPQRKSFCGMVAYGDHRLVIFGGYTGGNSTDELHVFNLKEGTWSSPRVSGTPPPSCDSFSLTKTDEHHAVMFGGDVSGRDVVSDVYLLDMQNWHWTKATTSGPSFPDPRGNHAACCIAGPLLGSQHSQLLVTGGRGSNFSVIADAWVLDLQSRTWMKVDVPDGVSRRYWHTLTVVSSGPTSVQLVEFGGEREFPGDLIAATAVLQLEVDKDQTQADGPLVWTVADVVTTAEPQRWKQRLELLQKLRSVRDLLEQKQTVAIKTASLILIGIPRSGKSSLLQRVLDPYADITPQPSTPVAESPIPVTIKKVSPITATVTGSKWSKQDLEDEKLHLIQHSLKEAAAARVESKPSSKTTSKGIAPETEAIIAEAKAAKNASRRPPFWKRQFGENIEPSASLHPQPQGTTSPQAESQGTSTQKYSHPISFETPDDMIASIARSAARLDSEEEQLLDGSIMLHLLDTGGQPEFLEILPALLTGPSINLLVFKLNEGLEERHVVEYVSSDGSTTEPYVSSFTVEEVLLQALSSVSNVAPPVSSRMGTSKSQSATMFVGTHKDLTPEGKITDVDIALQKKLKTMPRSTTKIIRYPNPSPKPPLHRLVIPIDNTKPGDQGVALLQQMVCEVLEKEFESSDIPIPWLMFHISVRSTNARVLLFRQCTTIAQACGIEGEDELKLALWYLSYKCGTLRYYEGVKDLEDIVICDLHILFDSISDLISCTFRFRTAYSDLELRFQMTGRCPAAKVEALFQHHNEIPLPKFLKLLEHLHFLSSVQNEAGEMEYFIPAVLRPFHIETLKRSGSASGQPAPLLLKLESGYCPTGLFSRLVVHLASPQLQSDITWRLCESEMYRNKVTYYIGRCGDEVTLIARPAFYEVWLERQTCSTDCQPLPKVCNIVRSTLAAALDTVKSSLHSSLTVSHQVAFYCQRPDCDAAPHPAVPKDANPVIAFCCLSEKPSALTSTQRMWYGQAPTDEKLKDATKLPLCTDMSFNRVDDATLADQDSSPSVPCAKRARREGPFEDVEDSQLDEDSLFDVLSELVDVTNWRKLGLALGLKPSTLDKIKIKHREDVDDCKSDMLECWLKMQDGVMKRGYPSWRTLVVALNSSVVRCSDIAHRIACEHQKSLPT